METHARETMAAPHSDTGDRQVRRAFSGSSQFKADLMGNNINDNNV